MNQLTKAQFAFILKDTQINARKKMIYAWCTEKGLPVPDIDPNADEKEEMKRIDKGYPDWINVDILSRQLNMPDLQQAVDDIRNNYMKRSTTRQWIVELPQDRMNKSGEIPPRIKIPETLKSLLSDEVINEIINVWKKRYGHLVAKRTGEPIKFE